MFLKISFLTFALLATACSSPRSSQDDAKSPQGQPPSSPNPQNQPEDTPNPQPRPTHEPDEPTIKGRSLGFKKHSDGTLAFGVTYTLASDQDGLKWMATFTTDITDAEIQKLPEAMYWAVIYKTGERSLFNAEDAAKMKVSRAALKIGQIKMTTSKESIASVILAQQSGFLSFGTTPKNALNTPSFVIELGSLCRSSPEYFSNLTNNKKCYDIKTDDVGLK